MYSRIQTIIFDVDGTLIDDDIHFCKHNKVLCNEFGLGDMSVTPDEWALIGGLSDKGVHAFIESKATAVGIDAARIPAFDVYLRSVDNYLYDHLHQIHLRAGAQDILSAAKATDVPLGLATNTTRDETEKKLDIFGLGDCFHFNSCLDDVVRPKPALDIYLDAIKKANSYGAHLRYAHYALVIEDTLAGATAALAAGCRTIWWRANDKDKTPPPFDPNLIVQYDADAIVQIIQRWGNKAHTQGLIIRRPSYD